MSATYISLLQDFSKGERCMETFMKSYHETYNAAKVNELLQRIKNHHDNTDVAKKVSEAMKTCGFNNGEIERVLNHLRGDRP
jgi:SOS response regulatory protein OraA/RecX